MTTKNDTKAAEAPAKEFLTTAEVADLFGTDTGTLRRFLRSNTTEESHPGKGGRYMIPASILEDLRTRFDARGAKAVTEIIFTED